MSEMANELLERPLRTRAWGIAAQVPDPTLPVVTIADLGVLRDVTETDTGCVHVQLTPLRPGCPSVEALREEVVEALTCSGYRRVDVELVPWPAWTAAWITPRGRAHLEAHGLLPAATPGCP